MSSDFSCKKRATNLTDYQIIEVYRYRDIFRGHILLTNLRNRASASLCTYDIIMDLRGRNLGFSIIIS